ncbi:MAG: glutamyl-tRNA reductase [Clostridium argentinense]|nr:glutamyl-tRNA reductase [Clostridium argentinense]
MIQLIGLNREVDIETRSCFSINSNLLEENLLKLKEICDEVVILSTCNRTEIYFTSENTGESIINDIFTALNWNLDNKKYIFHSTNDATIKHLMELCCGFHSKILGEDQILGQVKDAYFAAVKANSLKGILERLFTNAIACGKEFKTATTLYKIPVSASSIAVKEAINRNKRNYMIIGFGVMGKLCYKTLIGNDNNFDNIYIVGRNVEKIKQDELLTCNDKVKIISMESRFQYYDLVDTIISCTSSPNTIITKDELPKNKEFLIFDLAVPKDIEKDVELLKNVTMYDIDKIHIIDEENKKLRKVMMNNHQYIIEKYIEEYNEWKTLRSLSPHIINMINRGNSIYKNRFKTYTQKKYTKDNDKLVETLIKSTSNAYVNRAIEVLKEETLKGNGDEALKLIEKIFCDIN